MLNFDIFFTFLLRYVFSFLYLCTRFIIKMQKKTVTQVTNKKQKQKSE